MGDETNQQRQLRFFLETTRIEGELVAGLRKLPVTADRAKVDEAIDRLEQEYERDVLLGNALQRKFDLAALRGRITQYEARRPSCGRSSAASAPTAARRTSTRRHAD